MALRLEGVTRIIAGETHIAEINLELEPGSLNLLLGPTLSGKTSLMRLMAGLDRPSEGRVLVDGRDVTGNSVRQRGVALRTVHGVQDRIAQEDARRLEPDPRKRRPARVVHGTGAQAGRPDRVLPLAGARRLDAGRHQRAGLPEAGPNLAQLWWQNIGEAVAGEVTVDTATDNLAREPDKVMARIARSGAQGDCGPKLNDEIDAKIWLARPGSPKAKLANEKPQGETIDCDRLLQAWREGRAAPSKAAILCSPDKMRDSIPVFTA